jgi:hypothetical protein
MIHVIRDILVNTVDVTNLCAASNISLVSARQGMQRPYIAIDLEGTAFDRHNTGLAQEVYNVMVYITDTKLSDAWNIHEKVKKALSEFSGTRTVDGATYNLAQVSIADVMTDAHELHDFYVVAVSFNVFFYP